MRCYLCLVAFSLALTALPLLAEEKPDPRATVDSALDYCITLMEKKEHVKLIKECYSPSELEKQLRGMPVEELVKQASANPEFEAKSREQLAAWKEFKTKTPTYNEAKNEAKFPDLKIGNKTERLTFVKEGNLWYISIKESAQKVKEPVKSKE